MSRATKPASLVGGVLPAMFLALVGLPSGCASDEPTSASGREPGARVGEPRGASGASPVTDPGGTGPGGLAGGVAGTSSSAGAGATSSADLAAEEIAALCEDYCRRTADVGCAGASESECAATCSYDNWQWEQCRPENTARSRCAADSPIGAWFCNDSGPELLSTSCQTEQAAFWACLMRGNTNEPTPEQCPQYCEALTTTDCARTPDADSCAATCELFRVFQNLCQRPLGAYLDCISSLAPAEFECAEDDRPRPRAGACETETTAWSLCSAPFEER